MYKTLALLILSALLIAGCDSQKKPAAAMTGKAVFEITTDTSTLFDPVRHRNIPIAVFAPKGKPAGKLKVPILIMNHGYGQNRGGDYLLYTYITEHFAAKGFYVVSIQHELPTDSLMPMEGIPQVVRRSNWERGVVNIRFVLDHLLQTHPELDDKQVTLIGHSNGGDMSMLFATQYPGRLAKVISLDNRRVALPRTRKPKVYSLRSSDQPADEGVLPDEKTQRELGMTIIKLPATIHNDMGNNGTEQQHKEIIGYLDSFLLAK